MTYVEKLNNEERKAIEELRMRMRNVRLTSKIDETVLLYKFLKARDFDIDKAENMIRKTVAWRKAFQVDTILQDFTPKPFFAKYPKLSHIGFDKNGNMVKYMPMGKLDARDILKCVTMNEYMKHWIWHSEEIDEMARDLKEKTGKESYDLTVIIDCDKLTLANTTNKMSVEICMRLISILQDNYPECLNALYVINAPAYYVFAYSIIKTILSNAMIQKIHISGYNGWKEKLLEIIDADVLPAFLGGNRTDPDGNPLCTTFVTHGGKIPEIYYLPKEERYFRNESQVKRIIVPRVQKKEIIVSVTENSSRIQWEFLIKSKTLGFGLFYRISELELEEILPIHIFDTIDGIEVGSYKTKSKGEYIIVFDNSYSWWNSKEVEYCITVLRTGI